MSLGKVNREMQKIKYKVPNIITVIRIILVLLVAFAIIKDWKGISILFFTVLIYISDMLDGYLARRLNAESICGRWLDIMADGLYVVGITAIFTYSAIISPVVLESIIIEYLFFIFTSKFLSGKGHNIYDKIGKFVEGYYYSFTGIIIVVWMKDLSVSILLNHLSVVCVVLTVIGCVCRLQIIYLKV